MVKNLFFATAYVLISFSQIGCDENLSSDSVKPQVTIYSPGANDTLTLGYNYISYDAFDDQGLKYIDLYMNDGFIKRYTIQQYAALPELSITIDSSLVNTRISIFLVVTDLSDNTTKSNVMSNILVLYTKSKPFPPYDLSIRKITNTLYNLTWKDTSTYRTGYELWRKSDIDTAYILYKTLTGNVFNTNDASVQQNVVYTYKLRSFNDLGFSNYSKEVSTQKGSGTEPTNVSATAQGSRKVLVTWNDNSVNENYFQIERGITTLDFSIAGYTAPNTTSFTDSSNLLNPNTTYFYRIKIFTSDDSLTSSPATVTTWPYDLYPPRDLVATLIDTSNVKLNWNLNRLNELEIEIERKTGINGTYNLVAKVTSVLNYYDDLSVQRGKTYYYRARSTDMLNRYSSYSNETFVVVP